MSSLCPPISQTENQLADPCSRWGERAHQPQYTAGDIPFIKLLGIYGYYKPSQAGKAFQSDSEARRLVGSL